MTSAKARLLLLAGMVGILAATCQAYAIEYGLNQEWHNLEETGKALIVNDLLFEESVEMFSGSSGTDETDPPTSTESNHSPATNPRETTMKDTTNAPTAPPTSDNGITYELAIAAIVIGSVAIVLSLAAIGAVVYYYMKAKAVISSARTSNTSLAAVPGNEGGYLRFDTKV